MNFNYFRRPSRSAFTLIEMILVVAIIAILMAFLMPSLHRMRDTGKQVQCLAQQRQIGLAISLYVKAEDHVYPAHRNSSQTSGWFTLILDHLGGQTEVFNCPARTVWSCPGPHGVGAPHEVATPREEDDKYQPAQDYMTYGYNGYWLGFSPYPGSSSPMKRNFCRITDIANPAEVIVIADSELKNSAKHWSQSIWYPSRTVVNEGISEVHKKGANVLFADGHVKWYEEAFINSSPAFAGWWSPDPSRWR
ncbi:MAG: prepilin-type processing-associated H-X9-DG protein/prepilin-type N-terminal cleavage [Rhodothermales bacterium]|jgi:prepilin-type processing-associated H-X9-DG protein/prepilin-type N-terminal cleavage/methylation domain-containing protein